MNEPNLARTVAISKCESYEPELVTKAVTDSISYFGGMSQIVKPGEKVVLKLNLLIASEPDKAVTTHPAVVRALVEEVENAGGHPIIADSPGGPFSKRRMERVYKKCGITDAVNGTGARLNFDTESIMVSNPDGRILKSIETLKVITEADKIISVPKPKTHVLTTYTGAVKNLYGTIPGLRKASYHSKLSDVKDFCTMLLDVENHVKTDLTVMDAVIGMEGLGPSAGTPKKIGAIIAGTNTSAVDMVAIRMMGLDPEAVPTILEAIDRGIISGQLSDIDIKGARIGDFDITSFAPAVRKERIFPRLVMRLLKNRFTRKPVPQKGRCTVCGVCMRACPRQCITTGKGVAKVDYKKCIACFCCHELCPERAIEIK